MEGSVGLCGGEGQKGKGGLPIPEDEAIGLINAINEMWGSCSYKKVEAWFRQEREEAACSSVSVHYLVSCRVSDQF